MLLGAYKTALSTPDLHDCIVLKKDSMRNRAKIFEFWDHYDLVDISARFPVLFQFIPAEMVGDISISETIDLGK